MLEAWKGSPLVAFAAALLATLAVTPLVRLLAWRCDALARPDARRLHPEPIAQWGGLAVFIGVAVAAYLWRQPTLQDIRWLAPSGSPADVQATQQTLHLSTTFFGCGFLMLLLGMLDDRFDLPPIWKFTGQIIIVYVLWHSGVRIRTLPFTAGTHLLSDEASLALTMVWVLGLTNAMNFIDGVDGLATGMCAIGAASLCVIEWAKAPWAAAASAAICGACLGFLRYNFPPARIFLGDAGALLLGFWLATIAVAATSKTAAATTLALPMLVLAIPLFDTLWAVVRRALARQPIWRADRGHLHHRLLARGFSPRTTILVLYAVAAGLGIVAVLWARMRD
ncbi:MAG TPA: MraY family glycosyltransferase [Abditibacteriaceae bacterium]|nr:MraY family glycosyltransferase [Abditibacteriaceae bacterium]